jgi:hypothetical protein
VYPNLTHIPCTDVNAHAMHWLRRYLGAWCPAPRTVVVSKTTETPERARACLPDI